MYLSSKSLSHSFALAILPFCHQLKMDLAWKFFVGGKESQVLFLHVTVLLPWRGVKLTFYPACTGEVFLAGQAIIGWFSQWGVSQSIFQNILQNIFQSISWGNFLQCKCDFSSRIYVHIRGWGIVGRAGRHWVEVADIGCRCQVVYVVLPPMLNMEPHAANCPGLTFLA